MPRTADRPQVGVFGTMATITSVATTHTDNVGPMVYLD